jgi:NAD(P)-dependent dehydrogenase (short-subunit alcohol dehydrogenase family)
VAVLADKAVVVTGAGRGLGAAYARAIAAAGGAVVVNDVDGDAAARVVEEITAAGGVAVAHVADVSSWQAAAELIDRCVAEYGAVDGLVNNAGYFSLSRPQDQQEEPVRRSLEVNVFGAVACGVHALRHMVRAGRGSIVNVTSGEAMGKPASAIYGATKAAVATLTYSWAEDVRAAGVRVNAVSPNADTSMAQVYREFFGDLGRQNAGLPPEVNAPLVVYLLSERSREVTGQVVRLFGEELMLCTHPAILEPVLRRAEWTVEAIEEAFATDLIHRLQPPGVHRVRSEIVG